MTAREIAHTYGYNAMETILSQHTCNLVDDGYELGTYQPLHVEFLKRKHGLIPDTLVAYKNTFHPNQTDPEKTIAPILQNIFNELSTSESRCKYVRDKVADSLNIVNHAAARQIKKCHFSPRFLQGNHQCLYRGINVTLYACEHRLVKTK
ncbi:hypothetical protein ACJMK2_014468 [Sinanodonta woodiana]|uniref:Uncharacterized protein n=1 Tax=Sinanodonta woodiana TaxID=1069815 RepID=A0ABD3V162_SINWO